MCDVVYSHTHAKRMCVYTRLSPGVQGMSIRILLACQWLFIDNSLNWVKQPSPRGSLTSSLRVHTLWFCASPVMTTYIPRAMLRDVCVVSCFNVTNVRFTLCCVMS